MTLSLSSVAKTYGDGTRALNPTGLEINPGEIISLLGPSGCGKTTLLRLIAGLEVPDNGANIRFGDEDVTRLPVEKRNVGMVFQSYALFPNMSVRDNIGYGLKMQRLPRAEIQSRVDEVIALCRLEPYANRAITALSGGQRQRVALARAFAPRPRLMLLDEPLSALDAALRLELRDELAALLRQFGTTVIFVTHDQDEALAIADRVAVMEGGKIRQIGTPEELYRNPQSAFVAEFVGHAMPLSGEIRQQTLCLEGGELPLPDHAGGGSVYVRAEDLRADPTGPLEAKVETVTFLGTHYRLGLTGLTGQRMFALHHGASAPAIGDNLRLSIAPDALICLPHS
ncbi:Alpha-glucoside transport ATP-binding protein AglK [Tritonibacter mobilis]|uniref:ABC transporter ATP-binding protein n=1 Tax=Tritonibacter mobilis TaxID=379347 RepID=UPI000F6CAFBF|nr:ABC transporter ATP-binding protein [Tritonibacter mobilis]MCZ4270301.1 ABC transporter ATP-binding protein [Rhodobacteraceae bacterium G21628-S1]VCU61488.1 Alpha-glucoside transport ATP-binding protein AglK [Tritonibacter mobilis]